LGYRDGSDPSPVWIHFHWNNQARDLTMKPDARMKKCLGGARNDAVELVGATSQPRAVAFVGNKRHVKL
jgi:hypothetical protein